VGLFDLTGKAAVVVGGTLGLGRELSIGFAMAGANVVASSRTMEAVDLVADELDKLGTATLWQAPT